MVKLHAIILLTSLRFGDGKLYLNDNGKFIKKKIYVNVIRLQLSLVARSTQLQKALIKALLVISDSLNFNPKIASAESYAWKVD